MVDVKSSPWLQVLVACAFFGRSRCVLAARRPGSAQTDVPDAPTAVAAYSIESQKLEGALVHVRCGVYHLVQDSVEVGKRGVRLVPTSHKRSGNEYREHPVDLGGRPVRGHPHGVDRRAEYTVRVIARTPAATAAPRMRRPARRSRPRARYGSSSRTNSSRFSIIRICWQPQKWHTLIPERSGAV